MSKRNKKNQTSYLLENLLKIMITKTLDENTISLMPEDSDDLLTIRRILKIDDKIVGETTRVIKQEKEYSRPDKGERVHVRLAIKVEKISLDDV